MKNIQLGATRSSEYIRWNKKFNAAIHTANKIPPLMAANSVDKLADKRRAQLTIDAPAKPHFCLKFDYLPADDMLLIGKKVFFDDILHAEKD